MSWLARSIASSLHIDGDGGDWNSAEDDSADDHSQFAIRQGRHQSQDGIGSENQGHGGVREDLSEFKETLTRQLLGVASFLAPQPSSTPSCRQSDRLESHRDRSDSSCSGDVSDGGALIARRNAGRVADYAECCGGRGGETSNLSNSAAFRLEDEFEGAVGVTEEVLSFARNISHHPETWLDFPLLEEEDSDDFDMSDTQWNHAAAVEHLAPRLAALRIELCPAHISESYFWKVYLVLLHSRLNKHDAELLSTPQIVAARALWMQELQKQTKPEPDWFSKSSSHLKEGSHSLHEDINPTSSESPSGNTFFGAFRSEPSNYSKTTEFETAKYSVWSSENYTIDKSVIKDDKNTTSTAPTTGSGWSFKLPPIEDYVDDDGDDWLEENSDLEGYSGPNILVGTGEDLSFSDLEDDLDYTMPIKSKAISYKLITTPKAS